MPAKVVKKAGKYRVVNANTGKIMKTSKGHARDGGGMTTKAKAQRQANVLNATHHGWKPTGKRARR